MQIQPKDFKENREKMVRILNSLPKLLDYGISLDSSIHSKIISHQEHLHPEYT